MKQTYPNMPDESLLAVYFLGNPDEWLQHEPMEAELIRRGYDMLEIRKKVVTQVKALGQSPEYRLSGEGIGKALKELGARRKKREAFPPPGKL